MSADETVHCVDHWHCDPRAAAHKCDRPDRTAPCPTCGAAARGRAKKIKPAKRPSAKLVAGARDYVLDAYDTAAGLLTTKERLDLIATLREDLDLRQSEIEYAKEARTRSKDAPRIKSSNLGKLRIRQKGDRTVITLAGLHQETQS